MFRFVVIFTIYSSNFNLICSILLYNELLYDRVEMLNSSYVEGRYNFSEYRISKFNRTTYVANANAEFYRDIEDQEMEVVFHYNRLNNNQYTKSLINIKRNTICNIMDKYYKFLIDESSDTNFPASGTKLCPLKKVCDIFYLNFILPKFPNYHNVLGAILGKKSLFPNETFRIVSRGTLENGSFRL